MTSFPRILLSNTRSMVNKLEDISATISLNRPDIVVITEFWLTPCIKDDFINILEHSIGRKDQITRIGRGLYTYICSNLNFTELKELQNPDIECQWLLLKPTRLPRGINYTIMGTVYHSNSDDNILQAHNFEALDKALADYPNSAIFLAGDFNKFNPGNLCSSFKLKHLVNQPTRGNNIWDKIYSSVSTFYDKAQILPPMGMSDHSSDLLCLNVSVLSASQNAISKKLIQVRVCKPSKKDALRGALNAYEWSPIFDLESCTDKVNFFMSAVQTVMDTYIPLRMVKVHPNDKPWITPKLGDLILKHQNAWTKGCRCTYNFYRHKCNRECKKARRRFYDDKVSNNGNVNSSKWWDQVKQIPGLSKSQPLTNIFHNGEFIFGTALVEMINVSFGKVAEDIKPLPSEEFVLSSRASLVEPFPGDYIVIVDSVEKALSQIKMKKSVVPGSIPNWILKEFAPILSLSISNIFNASISQSHVPTLWKSADVIPIPKVSTPVTVDNDLRPISLTAVLSKVLEGYVFTWLY